MRAEQQINFTLSNSSSKDLYADHAEPLSRKQYMTLKLAENALDDLPTAESILRPMLDKNHGLAWRTLAYAQARAEKFESAIGTFERALASGYFSDKGQASIRASIAGAQINLGLCEEAEQTIDQLPDKAQWSERLAACK